MAGDSNMSKAGKVINGAQRQTAEGQQASWTKTRSSDGAGEGATVGHKESQPGGDHGGVNDMLEQCGEDL